MKKLFIPFLMTMVVSVSFFSDSLVAASQSIHLQAITEQELVENFGCCYNVCLPIADGDLPNDLFMDQFVQIVQDSSPDHWIHFHSLTDEEKTIILVLFDIINNGEEISLEDILARHLAISEIDQTESCSEEERLNHLQQKLDLFSEFYFYRQEVSDFNIPWSKWVSMRSGSANKCLYPQLVGNAFIRDWRHGYQRGGGSGGGSGEGGDYALEVGMCLEYFPDGTCKYSLSATGDVTDQNGNRLRAKLYRDSDGVLRVIVDTRFKN